MIEVVLASDRNLIKQAGITAIGAIGRTSLPLNFTFLTPAADQDHADWKMVTDLVRREGASCSLLPVTFRPSTLQLAQHLTEVTYYRLLLPRLLPADLHRVIYMDCDVYVGRDLAALWNADLAGKPLGAARDFAFREWSRLGIDAANGYFNAGVLLLDLDSVRRRGLFDAALKFSVEHPGALTWSDQCALNRIFSGDWTVLPQHWNFQHSDFLEDIRRRGLRQATRAASACVFHFNNYDRPWLVESPHPLKRQYLSVLEKYPQLDPASRPTLGQLWKWFKRTIKWRLISWSKPSGAQADAA